MKSPTLLAICASRKSEHGVAKRPSAVRQYGAIAVAAIRKTISEVKICDLANIALPLFEGLSLEEYEDEAVGNFKRSITAADAILIQAPAYWGGPSGVVKNLFDLFGGRAYDRDPGTQTLLAGKRVAILTIGAQSPDAERADIAIREIVNRQGAQALNAVFAIDNPREHNNEAMIRAAWQFGMEVAGELRS